MTSRGLIAGVLIAGCPSGGPGPDAGPGRDHCGNPRPNAAILCDVEHNEPCDFIVLDAGGGRPAGYASAQIGCCSSDADCGGPLGCFRESYGFSTPYQACPPLCEPVTGACVSCVDDAPCVSLDAGTPHCTNRGVCAECIVDSHCTSGLHCYDHFCAPCRPNHDETCPPNQRCTGGFAVDAQCVGVCGTPAAPSIGCIECANPMDCVDAGSCTLVTTDAGSRHACQ
jgi:hypothetical protein